MSIQLKQGALLSFSVSHWLRENTVFRIQLLMISLSFFPLSFSFLPKYYKGGACCPSPLRTEGKHYLSQWQKCQNRDVEDKQAWLFEQRFQGTGVRNSGCRLNEHKLSEDIKNRVVSAHFANCPITSAQILGDCKFAFQSNSSFSCSRQ